MRLLPILLRSSEYSPSGGVLTEALSSYRLHGSFRGSRHPHRLVRRAAGHTPHIRLCAVIGGRQQAGPICRGRSWPRKQRTSMPDMPERTRGTENGACEQKMCENRLLAARWLTKCICRRNADMFTVIPAFFTTSRWRRPVTRRASVPSATSPSFRRRFNALAIHTELIVA